MCGTPKPPAPPQAPDPIATPTYADAAVQKAGAKARENAQSTANRNVKSSALGVLDEATTKQTVLGGGLYDTNTNKKTKLGE